MSPKIFGYKKKQKTTKTMTARPTLQFYQGNHYYLTFVIFNCVCFYHKTARSFRLGMVSFLFLSLHLTRVSNMVTT